MPLDYYQNNVGGTLVLLSCMKKYGCHKLVFSSSATVYGTPEYVPIPETASVGPSSPYGHSKLIMEQIMSDWGTQ